MKRNVWFVLSVMFFLGLVHHANAQVSAQTERYRNDATGDGSHRKLGVMDGNLVRTRYFNYGQVGDWPFQPSFEWPKGTGQNYCDGVAVLISTEVTAPGNGQVVHPLETSYREWMDRDPQTGTIWGLEPVGGYDNPSNENPAISSDPRTYPAVWPSALNLNEEWNGFWYGYFGRGVLNADFETFFVMDDSKDGEWARPPYNYYPIASNHNRKGLGLRVEVRGFQWSHVLAEDVIFWHYDIANLADQDYTKTVFGFYTDTGVGGPDDNGDDNASYDIRLDLAYGFDGDGFGAPVRWKTGYYGYAYLESPGNALNGIDDDQDGVTDERRDDNIDNDGDWISYLDLNNNGVWDREENEPLNNDVGRDGVGPFDLQYIAPDEGEGDGQPTHGEPNYDETDKDESDQIGLTSLSIYRLGDGGTGGGWPKDDEPMWQRMNYYNFDTTLQKSNISMVFASGPFPLEKDRRERFSMALLFGNDLTDLIFNKETVQQIYNANYNFAKPPLKPTVKAIAGDGKVYLYWNSIAEESRDPFLGYQNNDPRQGFKKDFEGYLIYRSTEAEFKDIKLITDSHGEPKYWKPIAQFDLRDSISGPDPVGINGAHFYRGGNTGLEHSFVDTDVRNGVKYYYAVVSYDMGREPNPTQSGLQPSECTKIISEDFAGGVKFIDINCAIVTPNAVSAGYLPPQIVGDVSQLTGGIGTGRMQVNVLNPAEVPEGATYRVFFHSTGATPAYQTTSYDIVRYLGDAVDTLVKKYPAIEFGEGRWSLPFDGMVVSVQNDTAVELIPEHVGWFTGTSNTMMLVTLDERSPQYTVAWPADYEIEFFDIPVDTSPFLRTQLHDFKVKNVTSGQYVKAHYYDNDTSGSLTLFDDIVIIEYRSRTDWNTTWSLKYLPPFNPGESPVFPQAGDKFIFRTKKEFQEGDFFSFGTKAASRNNDLAKSQFSRIDVVPNPYIASADWERRTLNQTGRGDRKIDFINLPPECTLRIFTINGSLVKTLYKSYSDLNGSLSWNLVSDDGMDIAYGLYVYHVDAPGTGSHVGKFAVIK